MKTLARQDVSWRKLSRLLAGAFIVACAFGSAPHALAAPREPWWAGLLPESIPPLYHETFDEVYSQGMTNAQVTVGKYTYDESWSGFALQRSGDAVAPFVVPALDMGHTNLACEQGTIRFWFKPAWSSATLNNGTGPGAVATLLELDAIGKQDSANAWSLQINPDGTTLSLVAQSDGQPALLLQTGISWPANQSHMIALEYSLKTTTLFVDGERVAQGAGVPAVPADMAALIVGSSLAGKAVAGGDFDELFCFGVLPPNRWGRPGRMIDIPFYWQYCAPYAALGPVSAEEIAAREKRLAENKSNRASAQRSSSQMSSLAARNTCGPLDASACVTNGSVFMTNVWANLETNGTMTVIFDLVGGTKEPLI